MSYCFVVFGLCCKGTAFFLIRKIFFDFFTFLAFRSLNNSKFCLPVFLPFPVGSGRGRLGACVPSLQLREVAPALVASCAILLTSAKWERTHAPTHPGTHAPTHPRTHAPTHPRTHAHTYTHTRVIIFRPAIFRL